VNQEKKKDSGNSERPVFRRGGKPPISRSNLYTKQGGFGGENSNMNVNVFEVRKGKKGLVYEREES